MATGMDVHEHGLVDPDAEDGHPAFPPLVHSLDDAAEDVLVERDGALGVTRVQHHMVNGLDHPATLRPARRAWRRVCGTRQGGAMAEPSTPLPAAKAFAEDERSVLLGYLAYHRAVLARKAEGVSDEDARRPASPPSALTLLGMIRHMTDVERWWFRQVSFGEDVPVLFEDQSE